MIERQVDITTPAGQMSTFVCHPERGGPRPVILFFMDAPGIREELRDMTRRLATVGYYVLLPNLYYRAGVMELGPDATTADHPVRHQMRDLMAGLTIPMVQDDADALITFAGKDGAASPGPIGCVGYCMSGQHAVNTAARHPDRVAAAASIYGTHLVTDQPDSPHVMARQTKAELYFACAETDVWAPLEMVETLRRSLHDDAVNAAVEIYPAVEHGFAFPRRAAFDKPAAERHWERLFALFAANLSR